MLVAAYCLICKSRGRGEKGLNQSVPFVSNEEISARGLPAWF